MAVLTAAVVVLAVLCLLNLAVSAAVIRRLRAVPSGSAAEIGGLQPGTPVPEFSVETRDGVRTGHEALLGRRTLVAFFATDCPGCEQEVPRLARRRAELAEAGVTVLSVLLDTGPDRHDHGAALAGTGLLVSSAVDTATLMQVFRAGVTPSYFMVERDGTVVAKGTDVDSCLPVTVG
jgi:peroxiredoxin